MEPTDSPICRDYRADSRLAPSQWETSLQSNAISHWLGANLWSALDYQISLYTYNAIALLQRGQLPGQLISPWKKWPPLWQTTISNAFSGMKIIKFRFRISLKFVPSSAIDNKPALVQVVAWCRTGDKPLHEPMLTHIIDAHMLH